MQSVRFRHSDKAHDRVAAQLHKAVAARRPNSFDKTRSSSYLASLHAHLESTGKNWDLRIYLQIAGGITAVIGGLLWWKSGSLLLGLIFGLLIGAGLPHLLVNRAIKQRRNQFTDKFPDAIDLLVRGLRSGLPVSETFNVIAQEIPGPTGDEFKAINESIRIGRSMDEALHLSAEKLDTPEFHFFCITLAIQRETGGNLAETLANLSDVLRKRSQMKLKITAMSSEARASAYIVGSLPFFVFTLIYTLNPEYLAGFFNDPRLIIAGIGGLIWMSIGAFIMKQMISFEI